MLKAAVLDHKNMDILESYHNDYHAGGRHQDQEGTFRESMVSFDTQVKAQRYSIPKREIESRDNSFIGRIARTKFGHAAAVPLRASGNALTKKFAPRENGGFRESFTRAGGTELGVQLSRSSFDRGQFGARKKLKTKTQERMRARGRGAYDLEEGEAGGGGGLDRTSAATRGAGWQRSAATRVAKHTGTPAKVAFGATPEKRGGSPTKQQQGQGGGGAVNVSARGRFTRQPDGGGQLPPLPAGPLAGDGIGEYKRSYRSPPGPAGKGKVHPLP